MRLKVQRACCRGPAQSQTGPWVSVAALGWNRVLQWFACLLDLPGEAVYQEVKARAVNAHSGWGNIGLYNPIWLYWDNGKENGSY